MKPNESFITINDNLKNVEKFIEEIIITPKRYLARWATLTNQTPAAKIGYIGQHLTSLITGVQGTGSGARGDDLSDGSEVKSCNKVDQVDKCKNCGTRVLRIENECPNLDGIMEGTVKFGKGSTIVDCVSKELKILRKGPISIEQIRGILDG